MSRGLGVLQRQILERLAPSRPGEIPESRALSTADLVCVVFGRPWGAAVTPAERASVSRALNTLLRRGLVEVQRQARLRRSVAVWRLADGAWRQAEKLRQQRAGAARRENGRRRREQRDEWAKARADAYETHKAELRSAAPREPTERLAKLLGMLGSDHDGDRAAILTGCERPSKS